MERQASEQNHTSSGQAKSNNCSTLMQPAPFSLCECRHSSASAQPHAPASAPRQQAQPPHVAHASPVKRMRVMLPSNAPLPHASDSGVDAPPVPPADRPGFFSPTHRPCSLLRRAADSSCSSSSSSHRHGLKRARDTDTPVEEALVRLHMDSDENGGSGAGQSASVRPRSSSPTPSPVSSAAVAACGSRVSSPAVAGVLNEDMHAATPPPPPPLRSAGAGNMLAHLIAPPAAPMDAPHLLLIDQSLAPPLQQLLSSLPAAYAQLPLDVLALLLLWRCDFNSLPSAPGPLNQQQLMRALQLNGCNDEAALHQRIRSALQETWPHGYGAHAVASAAPSSSSSSRCSLAPTHFKHFYLHVFGMLRRLLCPNGWRSIDLATAHHFIALLLADRWPAHIHPFLVFLSSRLQRQGALSPVFAADASAAAASVASSTAAPLSSSHRFSFDQWSCLYEWVQTVNAHTLAGYEAEGSWPVLYDDFVTWMCGDRRADSGDSKADRRDEGSERARASPVRTIAHSSSSTSAQTASSSSCRPAPPQRLYSRLSVHSIDPSAPSVLPLDADDGGAEEVKSLDHHSNGAWSSGFASMQRPVAALNDSLSSSSFASLQPSGPSLSLPSPPSVVVTRSGSDVMMTE